MMNSSVNSVKRSIDSRSLLDINSSRLEIEGMNFDDRENEAIITVSDDVDTKEVADWRKLFSASIDQSLKFFPPQMINGQLIVEPPEDIFEEGIAQ